MNGTLAKLAEFETAWRPILESQAEVVFITGTIPEGPGAAFKTADDFSIARGFRAIGFNWELLDAEAASDQPRSAISAIAGALTNHMAFPQQTWLGEEAAMRCAEQFIAAFDHDGRQILTNRMDFGWNPLTDATIEWAFTGFDDEAIALLLLTTGK